MPGAHRSSRCCGLSAGPGNLSSGAGPSARRQPRTGQEPILPSVEAPSRILAFVCRSIFFRSKRTLWPGLGHTC
jgi:hypothetical protein